MLFSMEKLTIPSNYQIQIQERKDSTKKKSGIQAQPVLETQFIYLTTDYKYNYPLGEDYLAYVREKKN